MMSHLFFLCVLSLVVFQTTLTQSIGSLCANWKVEDGAGYRKHPTDCDKYVQCRYDGFGILTEVEQQCAFSTYWDDTRMTCVSVNDAKCPHDRCASSENVTFFTAKGNCRGYWKCDGKQSVAMCCPVGQKYDNDRGCIDSLETECNATCFNDDKTVPNDKSTDNTTVEEVQVCEHLEVSDITGMYKQKVKGWGWMQRYCPPGTIFSKEMCRCGLLTEVQRPVCKPEVHFPFTTDHKDASVPRYYASSRNVEVTNGSAKFNGVDSRLIIPRFTNIDYSTTFVIKIKYSSNHTTDAGAERVIVSNGACGKAPTILISEDSVSINFVVSTSEATEIISIPQLEGTVKNVVYTFDKGFLSAKNGPGVDSKHVPGYLEKTQCALHVGEGNTLVRSFKGEIDELSVYLCNPDDGAVP